MLIFILYSTIEHLFSIDYLIEKAVESAVNKTLMKVDEFVDNATRKVDKTVENAYDQAFAKFTKQVNELQPSAQKVDEVVNKAVDKAFTKFSEQAKEVQLSTKEVDTLIQKAFDEAFAKFSERLSELQTSLITQQNQQGAVNMEGAETAGHAVIENPRESEQEPMEIEGVEILSVANTEDDFEDEDSPEDSFDKTCEHPRPGSIYAIHMDNSRRSMLVATEDSKLIIWGYLDAEIGKNESQYCHWQCITGPGPGDSLCFQNMETRKYLGVDPERSHKRRPVVTSALNESGRNTKFYLQHVGYERFLFQTRVGEGLFHVMARKNVRSLYDHGPQVVCSRRRQKCLPPKWMFRKIEDQ